MYSTIGSIKARHMGNWFNPACLKGIESDHPAKPVYPCIDGAFFISKERLKGRRTPLGWIPPGPWRFSVRWVDDVGRISTVGKFQGHKPSYAGLQLRPTAPIWTYQACFPDDVR